MAYDVKVSWWCRWFGHRWKTEILAWGSTVQVCQRCGEERHAPS
jgi:hypothetical protein